ncbi:MAG TPA: hypothetical protein VFW93_02120 [Aquabacterium sp.]|uniref:hypothetical protein n=1 Tax=Aquabacterium sp. TaxID=1872578 RepID=UPI002E337A04|nr:hypothetical protein [Aquabacterium sp.]HEX5354986.1 hypothetical protein [Aquabacterium sp.]
MSDELSDFFALPPFKADEALVKLRRDLRELKPLAEKGTGTPIRFEWKGLPVIEVSVSASAEKPALAVSLAKRPSQRPEWLKQTLSSSADVRKWLDGLKLSLKRWDDED